MLDRRVVFDHDAISFCRRAFDGACWSVGISPRPHVADTNSEIATRDALARAVICFASAGVRDVQAIKASALRSCFGSDIAA